MTSEYDDNHVNRLRGEVALPPDQLEAVFESLDTSHSGFLTLEQFLAGVNHLSCDGQPITKASSEPDLYIQRLLGLNVLHKSGELMCEVRGLVGSEDVWHQLLAALFSDLNQLLRQISQLEETLRTRDHHHKQELQRLYEEFEKEVSEERDRLKNQLRQRESAVKAELTKKLQAKEQQVADLAEQRDELQERLLATQAQLSSTNPRKSFDANYQDKRETGGETHSHLQPDPVQSRKRAELQAQRSYAEGFSHAQHLAMLEEEGLVKQLRLLQEMQKNLKSGRVEDKHCRKFSFDDL